MGKSPFVRGSPSLYQKRRMSQSLETLTNGEGKDLKLQDNLLLLPMLFMVTSHNWPSPTFSFFFSWRCYLGGGLGRVSPIYTGGIQVIKLVSHLPIF